MSYANKRPKRPIEERDEDDTLRHADAFPVHARRGARIVDQERFRKALDEAAAARADIEMRAIARALGLGLLGLAIAGAIGLILALAREGVGL